MPARVATFSLVACDPSAQAWGVAVASKFPAVGARVPWAASNAGALATQSYANTSYGPRGLAMMAAGASAPQTLEALLSADEGREHRQVGLVDGQGRAATFTGAECLAWAGGRSGQGFAAQGNLLAGAAVLDAMVDKYLASDGDLPERLLSALLAGDRAGGDRRGRQSAALLVVKPQSGYGGYDDVWLDYRVDDHPDPVPELTRLLAIHRLYFDKSPEGDEVPLQGETLAELQRIMSRLGFYQGPIDGIYTPATRTCLEAFLGNENFEDRTDFERGRIDRPVVEYLQRRFAPPQVAGQPDA